MQGSGPDCPNFSLGRARNSDQVGFLRSPILSCRAPERREMYLNIPGLWRMLVGLDVGLARFCAVAVLAWAWLSEIFHLEILVVDMSKFELRWQSDHDGLIGWCHNQPEFKRYKMLQPYLCVSPLPSFHRRIYSNPFVDLPTQAATQAKTFDSDRIQLQPGLRFRSPS